MRGSEDKEDMLKDLDIIYKWAEENLMKFIEDKLEQISYGTIEEYSGNTLQRSSREVDRK